MYSRVSNPYGACHWRFSRALLVGSRPKARRLRGTIIRFVKPHCLRPLRWTFILKPICKSDCLQAVLALGLLELNRQGNLFAIPNELFAVGMPTSQTCDQYDEKIAESCKRLQLLGRGVHEGHVWGTRKWQSCWVVKVQLEKEELQVPQHNLQFKRSFGNVTFTHFPSFQSLYSQKNVFCGLRPITWMT